MLDAPAPLFRVAVTVPEAALGPFDAAMESLGGAMLMQLMEDGPQAGFWRLESLLQARPEDHVVHTMLALAAASAGIAVPAPVIETVAPRDWLAENVASFPGMDIGRFRVQGSHIRDPIPPGRLGIVLDAATAFGSGDHPTTAGCLLALQGLARQGLKPARVLDMGCGTGILAIGAAKLWPTRVLATDVDPEAVRVTRLNALRNGVAGHMAAIAQDGYRGRGVQRCAPYDLIVANILARPLCAMAGALRAHLAPGGYAVLAGLLVRQKRMVLAAHLNQGLALTRHIHQDGWSILVLKDRRSCAHR